MECTLRAAVRSVLSERPSREEVRFLVERCFRIARVYLRRRAQSGRLDPSFFGLSLDDLAIDCVAGLFERDDDDSFVQLCGYFEGLSVDEMSDTELLGATRRVVFSKVNEGLYRRYGEADPGLSKLVRNLRYAAKRLPGVSEERRNGSLWFLYGRGHETHGPIMPADFLEARLSSSHLDPMDLQDFHANVRLALCDSEVYCAAYPVVGLAQLARDAFERLSRPADRNDSPMPRLHAQDIGRFIHLSTENVKAQLRPTYVGNRKLDRATFDAYFEAARAILTSQCIKDHPKNSSYFDHLSAHVSQLSYENYRSRHRARFEYVVKRTREQFLADIQPHW